MVYLFIVGIKVSILDIQAHYQLSVDYLLSLYSDNEEYDKLTEIFHPDAMVFNFFGISKGHKEIIRWVKFIQECFSIRDIVVVEKQHFDHITVLTLNLQLVHIGKIAEYMPTNKPIDITYQLVYHWYGKQVLEAKHIIDYRTLMSKISGEKITDLLPSAHFREEITLTKIGDVLAQNDCHIPPKSLRCLLLSDFGIKSKLIAHLFKCSVETVTSNIKYARLKFRDAVPYGSFRHFLEQLDILALASGYCRFIMYYRN